MDKVINAITLLVIAIVVLVGGGMLLVLTRSASGDLNTGAIALVGPIVGGVVAYFFHSTTAQLGADLATGQGTTTTVTTPDMPGHPPTTMVTATGSATGTHLTGAAAQ